MKENKREKKKNRGNRAGAIKTLSVQKGSNSLNKTYKLYETASSL